MVCCSAVNCNNSFKKGYKLFRFPRDETRRMQWLQNCRRNLWKPSLNATLCEVHFENNQFELHRADGWKKLKPHAIPTLFNVPNPPKKFISNPRKSKYKRTVNIVNAKKTDIFQRDTELEHNYTYTNVTDLDVSQSYSISKCSKNLINESDKLYKLCADFETEFKKRELLQEKLRSSAENVFTLKTMVEVLVKNFESKG